MVKETKEVSGAYISKARTINSMYADGKIEVEDKFGNVYRIDVSEVLGLIQNTEKFTATKKAKYFHLTLSK